MRSVILAPVSLLLGLCLSGCAPKILGEKAPAFGSSAQYSTTAGFLTGHWKLVYDSSNSAMKGMDMSSIFPDSFLEFKPDHTCEFRQAHHIVHMTWKEKGKAIALDAVDVDGKPASQVKVAFDKTMNSSSGMFNSRADIENVNRGFLLAIASGATNLQLMDDKKRLFQADASGNAGGLFGTATWMRLDK